MPLPVDAGREVVPTEACCYQTARPTVSLNLKLQNHQKFLILSTELPPGPGGIGQHAWSLANALKRVGHEVTIQAEADYSDAATVERFDMAHQSAQFRIVRNARNGWRTYPDRIKTLARLIHTHRPDVLILTGRFSLWAGAWLKYWGLQAPTWAFVHGSEVGNGRRPTTRLTLWALQNANRIIAVSQFTRSLLPESIRQKTVVLPNGIASLEMPEPDEISAFPDWSGSPRLLTVGRVSPRKGQQRVIRALPDLLKRFPNVHYHIVGLPVHRSAFETLAQDLGVADHLTFHGKLTDRADLYRAYRSADVFVMLSENQPDGDVEGFGIAILEANHFGLPAIGAKGCGIEDAVKDGYNGYLVDGNDAASIIYAIQHCIDQRSTLGHHARQWAAAHDWDQLIGELLNHEAR